MTRARVAITVVFALNGVLFASIFSRLPAIKDRAGLGAGALGAALLCSMVGLLVSQVATGPLVARAGSRPLVLAGALCYAVGLVPVALSESFLALAGSFLLVGLANGALDVAMNVHGITVERGLQRPVLSSLHAFFSFGALAGAAAGGLIAAAGVGVVPHLVAVSGFGMVVALTSVRFLLPPSADAAPDGPRFVRPTRPLLVVGAFAFCVLLSEGAVNDWTTVYLDDDLDASEGLAAAGLAAFSLAMGVSRLAGDRLTTAFGAVLLARAGAGLAAVGIGLAIASPLPAGAIAGFAAAGVGLAALFPLAVRAAAERGELAGPSVSAVSAIGYCGFLAGPPAVGGLAEVAGLRAGLALVAVLCCVAALLAGALRAPVRSR
ncbi:MAG TPA: MFS transporter [Thermoleophilaceae bacterium]|nr:MFS transporter [Thermoleophilaceae bacterium]